LGRTTRGRGFDSPRLHQPPPRLRPGDSPPRTPSHRRAHTRQLRNEPCRSSSAWFVLVDENCAASFFRRKRPMAAEFLATRKCCAQHACMTRHTRQGSRAWHAGTGGAEVGVEAGRAGPRSARPTRLLGSAATPACSFTARISGHSVASVASEPLLHNRNLEGTDSGVRWVGVRPRGAPSAHGTNTLSDTICLGRAAVVGGGGSRPAPALIRRV